MATAVWAQGRLSVGGPVQYNAGGRTVQYHALNAGHYYGQYLRDAENAGLNDIAQFFRDTMKDDSARAARAHELLKNISGTDQAGPAAQ